MLSRHSVLVMAIYTSYVMDIIINNETTCVVVMVHKPSFFCCCQLSHFKFRLTFIEAGQETIAKSRVPHKDFSFEAVLSKHKM